VLHAIVHLEPPPLAEVIPGLPEELSRVVARAMRKDPEQRFPTMEALGQSFLEISAAVSEDLPPAAPDEPAHDSSSALRVGSARGRGSRPAPLGAVPSQPTQVLESSPAAEDGARDDTSSYLTDDEAYDSPDPPADSAERTGPSRLAARASAGASHLAARASAGASRPAARASAGARRPPEETIEEKAADDALSAEISITANRVTGEMLDPDLLVTDEEHQAVTRPRRPYRAGARALRLAIVLIAVAVCSVTGIWIGLHLVKPRPVAFPRTADAGTPGTPVAVPDASAPPDLALPDLPPPPPAPPDLGVDQRPPDQRRPDRAPVIKRPRPMARVRVVPRIQGKLTFADVTIDGKKVQGSTLDLQVTAGKPHVIEVRRAGFRPARRTVRLKQGEFLVVPLEMTR